MIGQDIKDSLMKTGFVVDNEYLDKYIELVMFNMNTPRRNGVTQRHHIIPKCVYTYNGCKVDNSPSNTVNLIYTDHIRAHYFLCMCANNKQFLAANTLAIRYVLKGHKLTEFSIEDIDEDTLTEKYKESKDHLYEVTHSIESCKKIQKTLQGRPSPTKGRKLSKRPPTEKQHTELGLKRLGGGNPFYGKRHSQETKDKISKANGHPVNMLEVGTGRVLKTFGSVNRAVEYLISIGATSNRSAFGRIDYVCKTHNVNHHAYGYSWEYCE